MLFLRYYYIRRMRKGAWIIDYFRVTPTIWNIMSLVMRARVSVNRIMELNSIIPLVRFSVFNIFNNNSLYIIIFFFWTKNFRFETRYSHMLYYYNKLFIVIIVNMKLIDTWLLFAQRLYLIFFIIHKFGVHSKLQFIIFEHNRTNTHIYIHAHNTVLDIIFHLI